MMVENLKEFWKFPEQKHISIIVWAILRVFLKNPPVRTSSWEDDSQGHDNWVEVTHTQVSDEARAFLQGN